MTSKQTLAWLFLFLSLFFASSCTAQNKSLGNKTTMQVSINGVNKTIEVKNNTLKKYALGNIEVADTGYVPIILKCVKNAGANFIDIQLLEIEAERDKLQFVGDDFYFGRRGPSVHLSYQMPSNKNIEWFYNEVTIPKGKDEIGSYYMANGFKEGYFYDTETQKWLLIASFKRPATHTWYTQPHSFLENFDPERGALNRKGFYNNQWVCDTSEGKFVTASGAWQGGYGQK